MTECQHLDTWFDRTLCACADQDDYNGVMHTICVDCGAILGPDGIRHQRYLDSIPVTLLMDTPEDMARLARALWATAGSPDPDWDANMDDHYRPHAAAIMQALRP